MAPSIDLDVLNAICAFTEYPDLFSLSLTCFAIRPLAIRTILKTRPVLLHKATTIIKFHNFVFSDTAARIPHIIALVIDIGDSEIDQAPQSSEQALEALIAILRQASSLKSLELRSSAHEQQLGYLDDPRLSTAVGQVGSLRALTISGMTEVADFIGAIRFPLRKLALGSLNLPFRWPPNGCQWSPPSFGVALPYIAHSLENFAIKESHVHLPVIDSPPRSLPAFTQFSALRSLTLNTLVGGPHLPSLFELFPNLDGTLHITTFINNSILFEARLSDRYYFFRRAREQNGTAQERGQCWRRLEHLICDVETLFALNLRCPVNLTTIHDCPLYWRSDARRYLAQSLRDHPPTHFNLQLTIWSRMDDPSLAGLFPPEAEATLTHFTLCVQCDHDCSSSMHDPTRSADETLRWDSLWGSALLPGLASLRSLTHLRLVFHCEAWKPEEPARPISEDPLVKDLRPTSTSRFNFDAMGSGLADALPALQYCFITNSARLVETKYDEEGTLVDRWCLSRAYRIARGLPGGTGSSNADQPRASVTGDICGTRRELIELGEGVAETIIERENLILSAEEESAMKWQSS